MKDAGTSSITIHRPRPDVWRQLTTLDELADWYDDWDNCEHQPSEQRLREGTIFRLRSRRILGMSAECRVVTVDEPKLLRWIERRPVRAPILVAFRLEATTPQSTVVTHSKTLGRLRRTPRVDQGPPPP